jgi:hypothetical protein
MDKNRENNGEITTNIATDIALMIYRPFRANLNT